MADIPINAIDRRIQFTGNTGLGPFAFTFNILADSDIVVYKNDTLLTLTTDYTISTSADGTGSVTLTGSGNGTALVSSDFLTIVGGRQLARTTDFVTAGDLLASSLNEQLDSNVIMVQQLDEKIERTLRIDQSDVTADMVLPKKDDRANKTLGFDANGLPAVGEEIGDYKGNWAASTTYAIRDLVKDTSNDNIYRCNTAHTSSGAVPLSSNVDIGKWDLIVDAETAGNAKNDAEKLAIHPEDSQFTLSDGVTTGYSALHHKEKALDAQTAAETAETNAATSESNSQDWAVKTNGIVDSTDYSSKAWANGGTNITASSGAGASKEWAIGGRASVADTPNATTVVDGTEYSAKGYAIGDMNRGSAGSHSAKDWASYVSGTNTVDGTYKSARAYAIDAANSVADFNQVYYGTYNSDSNAEAAHIAAGNTVAAGDLYFSSTTNAVRYYDGVSWTDIAAVDTSNFATAGFAIAMSIAL